MPDFLDLKTIYLIFHIFGTILGAGGAYMSDLMFFSSIKDGRIEKQELHFLELGSRMVWLGIGVLIISGVLLISTDSENYLRSPKLLAKLSIVAIIILNGIIFHLIHIPHIRKHVGITFVESPLFIKKSPFLLASGAISMVSWMSTVILGTLNDLPYNYFEIMSAYFFLVILATISAISMKRLIFRI